MLQACTGRRRRICLLLRQVNFSFANARRRRRPRLCQNLSSSSGSSGGSYDRPLLALHKSRFKEHLAFPDDDDDEEAGDSSCSAGGAVLTPSKSSSAFVAHSRFTPKSRTRFDPDVATGDGSGTGYCPGTAAMRTGTDSRTSDWCWRWYCCCGW